jgi:hypothetical protein
MITIREQQQFEIARALPPEVLLRAATEQAKDAQVSEAYCRQMSEGFARAAEIARRRRVRGTRRVEK